MHKVQGYLEASAMKMLTKKIALFGWSEHYFYKTFDIKKYHNIYISLNIILLKKYLISFIIVS